MYMLLPWGIVLTSVLERNLWWTQTTFDTKPKHYSYSSLYDASTWLMWKVSMLPTLKNCVKMVWSLFKSHNLWPLLNQWNYFYLCNAYENYTCFQPCNTVLTRSSEFDLWRPRMTFNVRPKWPCQFSSWNASMMLSIKVSVLLAISC